MLGDIFLEYVSNYELPKVTRWLTLRVDPGSETYGKVNLSNTRINGVRLGIQMSLHQLPIIADGRMVWLTSGAQRA